MWWAYFPMLPINPARFDILSLRLAVACSEFGSLTHAAPQCNISLMCASRRLQKLEQSLGVVLFYRRKEGLVPTEAGHMVARTSRQVIQLIEQMTVDAQDTPPPEGDVFENCGRTGKARAVVDARGARNSKA